MINLIPNEEKKIMIKDFYHRLAETFFIALGVVALIASAALLPSYLLSSAKRGVVDEKLEAERAILVDESNQETLSSVSDLESKLALIEKYGQNKFAVSREVIEAIVKRKNGGIKILQITFEQGPEKNISVRGTARSREELLLFRRVLEENPAFKKVDLPISNFVKGTNIQFYLTFIIS